MSEPSQSIGFKLDNHFVLGKRVFKAPLSYQDSLIDEARLIIILKGHSTLFCAGEAIELQAGDILLMRADNFINQWHKDNQDSTVEFIGFRLTSQLLNQLYPKGILGVEKGENTPIEGSEIDLCSAVKLSSEQLKCSTLLANYIQSIEAYMAEVEIFNNNLVRLKVIELIELVLALDKTRKVKALLERLFSACQPQFQRVVQAHLFTPVKSSELAFLCHMSEATFNRKFKQIYGTSANKYLMNKRLEKAHHLVMNSSRSLTEIALECGFIEQSYFSRVFKQKFAQTPSTLRKDNERKLQIDE